MFFVFFHQQRDGSVTVVFDLFVLNHSEGRVPLSVGVYPPIKRSDFISQHQSFSLTPLCHLSFLRQQVCQNPLLASGPFSATTVKISKPPLDSVEELASVEEVPAKYSTESSASDNEGDKTDLPTITKIFFSVCEVG